MSTEVRYSPVVVSCSSEVNDGGGSGRHPRSSRELFRHHIPIVVIGIVDCVCAIFARSMWSWGKYVCESVFQFHLHIFFNEDHSSNGTEKSKHTLRA